MPSESKAQFGKMGVLYRQGKISRKTLEDFNKGVHPSKLPQHAGGAIAAAAKRRAAARRGR